MLGCDGFDITCIQMLVERFFKVVSGIVLLRRSGSMDGIVRGEAAGMTKFVPSPVARLRALHCSPMIPTGREPSGLWT